MTQPDWASERGLERHFRDLVTSHRVKRRLDFGGGDDDDVFFAEEQRRACQEARDLWGFDFSREEPVQDHERWSWEKEEALKMTDSNEHLQLVSPDLNRLRLGPFGSLDSVRQRRKQPKIVSGNVSGFVRLDSGSEEARLTPWLKPRSPSMSLRV